MNIFKWFVMYLIVIWITGVVGLMFNNRNQANNKRFDTCFATYQSEGMPREMYNEFMKDCYEVRSDTQTLSELSFVDNTLDLEKASAGLNYEPTLDQISICFHEKVTDIQKAQVEACQSEDYDCLVGVMVEVCELK